MSLKEDVGYFWKTYPEDWVWIILIVMPTLALVAAMFQVWSLLVRRRK